ncbi:MAG: hypothetical protein ACYST3_06730, partial [Planctomycetota bacterium]
MTKKSMKVILINISLIILILGIFELYFWKVETSKLTYRPTNNTANRIEGQKYHTATDDILGYALVKNSKRTVTRYVNDKILYSVTYTIDNNGLRISPTTKRIDAPAILFFGGSFTYGEGVNDDETLPYITGILTGNEYATYNFGVHGHGPQHMLAEIEHGIVGSVITHEPKYAVYQAIPDHIRRLKGLEPWLMKGPHYSLDENGKIISLSISTPLSERIKAKIPLLAKIKWHLIRKSYLYRTINRRILRIRRSDNTDKSKPNWTDNDDIKTFTAVVDRVNNLLISKYPGIELHVIFWDEKDTGFSEAVIAALEIK